MKTSILATLTALCLVAFVALSCAAPAAPTPAPSAPAATATTAPKPAAATATTAPKPTAAPAKPTPAAAAAPAAPKAAPPAPSAEEKWKNDLAAWEKETYQAAQKEGKVVWLTSDVEALTNALVEAFEKKYPGVKLEVLFGRGAANGARIVAEQDANKLIGDMFTSGLSVLRPMIQQDRVVGFVPLSIKEPGVKWLADPMKEQANFPGKGVSILQSFLPTGLIINTRLVSPDREPKTWREFGENPFWKDKLIARDPRQAGSGAKGWLFFKKWYGEEFWQKLAAQNIAFDRATEVVARAVATGEYHAGLMVGPNDLTAVKDAPLKYLVPEEGAMVTEFSNILLKGAPHPNAAKLYMNFLITKEAQDILGLKGGATPVRADAKLESPNQDLSRTKVLITTMEEDLNDAPRVIEDVKKYHK